MRFNDFVKYMGEYSFDQLPGQDAQLRMAPGLRREEIRSMGSGNKPVESGVMILIFPCENEQAHTVLIKRPLYDGVHSGQISFPGGRREKSDRSITETALRETQEEIGVEPAAVDVTGKLTDLYIPPSNYIVSPVVGLMHEKPLFTADEKEVDRILEIPVNVFFDDRFIENVPINMSSGECIKTPCFLFNGHIIWGATAMILSEFKEMFANIMNNTG